MIARFLHLLLEMRRPRLASPGTRSIVRALGISGISKNQVSRPCVEIDERVSAFLEPLEGDWPYLWIDATYVKVRQNGRIVSVAVIVAVGVNTRHPRERGLRW
jgi:putative transposase